MYKESAERLQGNDAYEGYGIDLIAEISQILSKAPFFAQLADKAKGIFLVEHILYIINIVTKFVRAFADPTCLEFNYSIKWVDDGAYGSKNKETGEWNGLIGELLSQVGFNRELLCQTGSIREFLSQVGFIRELLSQVGFIGGVAYSGLIY